MLDELQFLLEPSVQTKCSELEQQDLFSPLNILVTVW